MEKKKEGFKSIEELQAAVVQERNIQALPTAKGLERSGVPVYHRFCYGEDWEAAVYANGLILYRHGDHRTVFRLHKIEPEYAYTFLQDVNCRGEEKRLEIKHIPCDVSSHILLIGEDRLLMNSEAQERKFVMHSVDFKEDHKSVADKSGDPLTQIIDRETELLKQQLLWMMPMILTSHQMRILHLFYRKQMRQEEIAKELGIARASVADAIRKSKQKLLKVWDMLVEASIQDRREEEESC